MQTADLCDQFASEISVAESILHFYGAKRSFQGKIATVKVYEDNVLVKKAVQNLPPNTVLVVDGGASKRCALLGDRVADLALQSGLAGIIIHGCVRDSAQLAQMDLGILALGTSPLKSKKTGKGEDGVPLSFAGITWHPGHYVYADQDGMIVAKRELK
ncbi:ribonuclease E activity regulator RraA [Mechercharimyces sp. CAU 1602]|uniref:ribonuclease E activity regulator RraA n=1 Tax=Mechercharimyces sp. CAU 1602 TaxID=2973933 RepID=UPI002161C7BF|nr:ribonuclease E activity regulator RraA [Mechercharimyces sp. CAU 1602]MCS1351843.1 ribonuclease E activity regulator RraA [Mechercharimyces sp. CAU 1602]